MQKRAPRVRGTQQTNVNKKQVVGLAPRTKKGKPFTENDLKSVEGQLKEKRNLQMPITYRDSAVKRNKKFQTNKTKTPTQRHVSHYAQTLFDPEMASKAGVDTRYPDHFDDVTFALKSHIDVNDAPSVGGTGQFGPFNMHQNDIIANIVPSIHAPLRFFKYGVGSSSSRLYGDCVNSDTDYGFYSSSQTYKISRFSLEPGVQYDIVVPYYYEDIPSVINDPIYYQSHYYYPNRGIWNIRCPIAYGNGAATATCQLIEENGTVLATETVNVVNAAFQFTFAGATHGSDSLPGTRLIFSVDQDVFISSISVEVYNDQEGRWYWQPFQLPNLSEILETCDKYRVVGMSSLATNFTNVLDKGGSVVSLLNRGGEDANDQLLFSKTVLSEKTSSRNASSLTGDYTWWRPYDDLDMQFRDTQLSFRGVQPYIMQIFSNQTQPQVIRFRVFICYELTSHTQMIASSASPVDTLAIEIVSKLIRKHKLPSSMENDIHHEIMKWAALPFNVIDQSIDRSIDIGKKLSPYLKYFSFIL